MTISVLNNIASLRAQRELSLTSRNLSEGFERLASGKRINHTSDDAAGLAIAESLNASRRLTTAAIRNVNDGASVINILTSAIDSQKQILTRMAELAEQSANGVYSSEQRQNLNGEYEQLLLEFDRIADTTEFNGVKLLRNRSGEAVHLMAGITAADTSLIGMTLANSHRFSGIYAQRSDWTANGIVNTSDVGIARFSLTADFYGDSSPNLIKERAQDYATLSITDSDGKRGTLRIGVYRVRQDGTQLTPTSIDPPGLVEVWYTAEREDGDSYSDTTGANTITPSADGFQATFAYTSSGATATFKLDLSGIRYQGLDAGVPIRNSAVGFTNLESTYSSRRALDTIFNRLDDMSALQGEYGALQSRLDLNNSLLTVRGENFAAAESRIRDADMASESANLVRNQILQQTAAQILAQANQQPALALRLLNTG